VKDKKPHKGPVNFDALQFSNMVLRLRGEENNKRNHLFFL